MDTLYVISRTLCSNRTKKYEKFDGAELKLCKNNKPSSACDLRVIWSMNKDIRTTFSDASRRVMTRRALSLRRRRRRIECQHNSISATRRHRRLLLLFRLAIIVRHRAGQPATFPRDRAEDRRHHVPDLIHRARLPFHRSPPNNDNNDKVSASSVGLGTDADGDSRGSVRPSPGTLARRQTASTATNNIIQRPSAATGRMQSFRLSLGHVYTLSELNRNRLTLTFCTYTP